MAVTRRGGIVFLSINGIQYDVKGVATYEIVGLERADVVGQDGIHGYSERPVAATLKLALTDVGTLDLKELALISDATIALQLANSKTISFRDAWGTGNWQAESSEGEITAEFHAKSAQEILG